MARPPGRRRAGAAPRGALLLALGLLGRPGAAAAAAADDDYDPDLDEDRAEEVKSDGEIGYTPGLMQVPQGGDERVIHFAAQHMEPRHAIAVGIVANGSKRHKLLEDVAGEVPRHLVGIGVQFRKGERSSIVLYTYLQNPEPYEGKWTRTAVREWLLGASYPLVNRMKNQFAPHKYLYGNPFGTVLVVKPLKDQSDDLVRALEPYARKYRDRLKFTFFTRAPGTQTICDTYGVWTNDELQLLESPTDRRTTSHSHEPLKPKYRLEGVTPESVARFFDAYANGTWPRYFKSAAPRGPPRTTEDGIRELTAWDFGEVVGDPEAAVLVEFVSKDCDSCVQFAPTMAEVARGVAEARRRDPEGPLASLTVARIDQSENEHSEFVTGTPWLLYWPRGSKRRPVEVNMRGTGEILDFLEESGAEEDGPDGAVAPRRSPAEPACAAAAGGAPGACAAAAEGGAPGPAEGAVRARAPAAVGAAQVRLPQPDPEAARAYLRTDVDPGG